MIQMVRFFILLLVALGLLATGAWRLTSHTSRRWTEQDVKLSAELALKMVHRKLHQSWLQQDLDEIRQILEGLVESERIIAAAVCRGNNEQIITVGIFPPPLACLNLSVFKQANQNSQGIWGQMLELAHGRVYVSALPLANGTKDHVHVVLYHDMSFADRRESYTNRLLLGAFCALTLFAALITVLIRRLTWRTWTKEMRSMIREGVYRPEFMPVLRDVQDLQRRLRDERRSLGNELKWTPERLQQTLREQLHGEKVLIMANREPYIHQKQADGSTRILHPASGLVTALEPVMRACSGVWIAHGSGSADRDVVDKHDRIFVPPGEDSYQIRRVWLSQEEENGYYYGFANEGLWPLCHIAHVPPIFRTEDWNYYQSVNEKFALATLEEAHDHEPIIFVQDYHFALAPRILRNHCPNATILTFWHIPWPNAERLSICPYNIQLLEGMLGSSILGFHTQFHCNNFFETVDRFLEARIDRENNAIIYKRHTTLIRPYPISIEWPARWAQMAPPVEECRRQIVERYKLAADIQIGVGVDRLDYTKGIDERLRTVERLLERHPQLRGHFVFIQLAAPSRTDIAKYQELNQRVEILAEKINERFGDETYKPIILSRQHHEPQDVFTYYRAADFCYVSSLHDGMNLVAKEFVAARDDHRGVLILSCFTGASRELLPALIVNPYDLEKSSTAMYMALKMPLQEQGERMINMRSLLSEFNIFRWAGRILIDATQTRSRRTFFDRWQETTAELGRQ